MIDGFKFEITSLRKDILTDGRHAKVQFTKDWKEDALRRDFTINSIYSDQDGNLFDPFNGKKDLEDGFVKFIGDVNERVKEDYLRIVRYLRFFSDYSKHPHNFETISKLKVNINGIGQLSKERLLDELKKISKPDCLEKLCKNKLSLELILMIYPELKNIKIFSKLNFNQKEILNKFDFIFLLSLMVIDETDNTEYFLYKYNLSKKNQKRIKVIENFFKENMGLKSFSEKKLNKIFYYDGKQAVIDIIDFSIIKSKKTNENLIDLKNLYNKKTTPTMPVKSDLLMTKYNIPEGKQLGLKLKMIETEWVENNFQISDRQIESIINN